MSSWLQRQRKAALVQLAEQAGIDGTAENMRKEDIITALEQHLQSNSSTLSNQAPFQDYFNRIRSPVKKESEALSSSLSENVARSAKARGKRVAKMLEFVASHPHEQESTKINDYRLESSPDSPVAPRAPRIVQEAMANLPRPQEALQDIASSLSLAMPPSPAAVTDLVERQTDIATRQLRRYYYSFDIPSHLSSIRENLSSVLAVETAFLLLEAWGLQRATLPWRYAFSLPASAITRDKTLPMYFPDFFALLTGAFWGPTTLWVATSLLLPMIVGWLVNFNLVFGRGRHGGYEVDPLVFNITKILVTWLVYSQGFRLGGLVSASTVAVVQGAILGGWRGIVIGATVTAIMTLYEAVLRR